MIKSFDDLIQRVTGLTERKTVAVVCAHDMHTLEAVVKAEKDNLVRSILIGDELKIKDLLSELDYAKNDELIINAQSDQEAAKKAVDLAREDKVHIIMKGKIQTADLMGAVVDKEKGLRTGRVISHLAFNELDTYHKLLVITDSGMSMYPNLDQKKEIIDNGVAVLRTMGIEQPKVAIIAAVEKLNPKMPETVDAAKLKKMNESGGIRDCVIDGPISYDLAMSKESAEIKGFKSAVTGDADLIVVPNITVGNVLGKALVYSAKAKMAGFITGAKVPIVLTSRGSSSEEKYLSIALCAMAADKASK